MPIAGLSMRLNPLSNADATTVFPMAVSVPVTNQARVTTTPESNHLSQTIE
jgi:hypothetical protein